MINGPRAQLRQDTRLVTFGLNLPDMRTRKNQMGYVLVIYPFQSVCLHACTSGVGVLLSKVGGLMIPLSFENNSPSARLGEAHWLFQYAVMCRNQLQGTRYSVIMSGQLTQQGPGPILDVGTK
jgi:hypothetical protein